MLALLDRLTFLRKFLLLGLIGAVAVGVPASQQVQRVWADYRAAVSEQAGVVPAELVLHAMHYLLELRDLTELGQASGEVDPAALAHAAEEVTTSLGELDAVLRSDARFAEALRRAGEARSQWTAATSANDAQAFAATHGSLDGVLDAIRDESGFSYTPHRDAFHMQLGLLSYAPEAEAAVSLLRVKGVDVLARLEQAERARAAVPDDADASADGAQAAAGSGDDSTAVIRAELQSLRALADTAARRQRVYERELEKVIAINPGFAQSLGQQHDQVEEALDEALRVAESVADGQGVPAQRWFAQISAALLAQHEFNDTAIEALSGISARHAVEAREMLVGLCILLAVLLGGALLMVTAVTISILRGVGRAQKGAEEIANLHLDNDLRSNARDEIGALLRALGRMQEDLKRRIESERRVAQENARVRAALDTASSGVMIADADGVIVYMNRAVQQTLTEAQGAIRANLPHFAVDKVIGSKFDLWHTASGGHQAQIDRLEATHTGRIRLGGRVLELFINPVRDPAGVRVGTSLEWLDRTAESEFRHGLRNVVQRAAAGFLNARVEVKVEDERFIELADIVNNLIGTTEKAVGEVETVMSALARGNLSVRSDAMLLGRFGELNDNANATAEALAGVISEIQSVVGEINSAASEIAQGNGDLSRRTEQAAASIEETAAALHEVNSMVGNAAQNAGEAKTLAGRAAETAADGGEVVKQVVRTMQAIRESSKQMSEIISVIDGIAFQTNILALNAAVEAARAGEQGRGFAVVASEVRALAQRSADAAKQIAGLIRDAEQRVEGGAVLVQQAGERMDSIVGSARQVADIIADIAAGAVEQSKGISEVNAAVEQLDQATQANAALVEEMAASAQALSQQATALNGVASRFVLDTQGQGRAAAPRRAGVSTR